MTRRSLKDLIRQVFASGVAVGAAAQALPAAPAPNEPVAPAPSLPEVASIAADANEVVLRKARPRVLLRALDATRVALVSSHRSHRSHSSHYSSRGGGTSTPAPPRPRDTTPPPPRGTAAPAPSGRPTDTTVLGARTLRLGMTGPDVDQLIMLLVRKDALAVADIPQTPQFTSAVESAVKRFQTSKSLPANGVVDYRTLLLLRMQ